MSDLKLVVDKKHTLGTPTVPKAERGEKGDRGEPGQRGPSGLDVSMTKGIKLMKTPVESPDGTLHFEIC